MKEQKPGKDIPENQYIALSFLELMSYIDGAIKHSGIEDAEFLIEDIAEQANELRRYALAELFPKDTKDKE